MPLDNLGIQLDRNIPNAAVVAQVAPGSPAQQAGVMAGDQIVAVNDQEIHSPNEFLAAVNQVPADASLNLSLSRNVQQNVQVQPSTPVPVTAAKPVVPAVQNPPINQGPPRRIFRRR
jgi:S1-C subfamily serine protease